MEFKRAYKILCMSQAVKDNTGVEGELSQDLFPEPPTKTENGAMLTSLPPPPNFTSSSSSSSSSTCSSCSSRSSDEEDMDDDLIDKDYNAENDVEYPSDHEIILEKRHRNIENTEPAQRQVLTFKVYSNLVII